MAALSLRLPDGLESRLDAEAKHMGVPRSEVARAAIEEFLARRSRERFMAGFVAEARAAYADPSFRAQAVQLAGEALDTDNEALAAFEAAPAAGKSGRRRPKAGAR